MRANASVIRLGVSLTDPYSKFKTDPDGKPSRK
jgi:hypothetical protein